MARNSKDGKESDVAKKLIKEAAETEKRNEERHAEMVAEEAAKAKKAKEESDNQAEPVAKLSMSEKARKDAWDDLLKIYEERNPVKFAAKKARGEFKEMPAHFTGGNHLNVS